MYTNQQYAKAESDYRAEQIRRSFTGKHRTWRQRLARTAA